MADESFHDEMWFSVRLGDIFRDCLEPADCRLAVAVLLAAAFGLRRSVHIHRRLTHGPKASPEEMLAQAHRAEMWERWFRKLDNLLSEVTGDHASQLAASCLTQKARDLHEQWVRHAERFEGR